MYIITQYTCVCDELLNWSELICLPVNASDPSISAFDDAPKDLITCLNVYFLHIKTCRKLPDR